MGDELDAYLNQLNTKAAPSNEGRGLVGRFTDLYDRFDQSWLPQTDSEPLGLSDLVKGKTRVLTPEEEAADYLGPVGRGINKFNRAYRSVTRPIVDAAIGSPVRALGTVGTIVSGGATKLPSVVRGGIAGLDAIDAARSGLRANEEYQKGNYLAAAGNVIGAGLQSASTMIPLSRKVSKGVRSYAEPVAPSPVTKQVPGVNELNVTNTLPEVQAPVQTQQALLGQRPPPTQFSRTVVRNQPKGLLEEKNIPLANQRGKAPGVALTEGQDVLAERATRELDALGFPADQKNINRYLNDKEFQKKIQLGAEQTGNTGRYESTLGTKYVQEAPVPRMTRNEPTVDDIRQALKTRGVNATDQFLAKIRKDPELQTKLGLRDMFMEGVAMPGQQVKGLLTTGESHMIPKDVEEVFSGGQSKLFSPDDDEFTKLDKMIASDKVNPEVTSVVQKAKDNLKRSSSLNRFEKSLDTSMERELEKMGPVGGEIARQVKIASTDKPIRFNSYIKDVRKDIEATDTKTWESIVDHLDKSTPLKDEKARDLAGRIRTVLDQTGTDLNEAGLLEKGQRQTYWPHRYEKEATIKEALKAQGMDETQIKENLQRIRDFREQKISGEFSRNDLNVPGYRKDKDVLIDHLRDVSNRVEDATRFGAKDINDPKSAISQLVNQSENPERARELMTRILRGDAVSTETQKKVASAARQFATTTQLSLAGISNFGGTLPIIVRSAAGDAINGIGRAFQKELPDMKFMENTNLFRKFSGGFAETVGDNSLMYRIFGIEGSQNLLNRYAGAVGNSYAQTLFEGLKKNPSDTRAIAQLEDLVLDKGSEVLKQGALTDKQLERAMVRMAEITQGVTENRKLPYFWNKEGLATIPQIFLRTSFQTTKALKDAVKMDPKRAIPKLLGSGLAIGEVIGDVKEAAKTGAQVGMNSLQQLADVEGVTDKNFLEEYKKNIGITKDDDANDRFSFTRKYLSKLDPELAKNDILVRGLGNLEQSFALGMPVDIARSMVDAIEAGGPDRHTLDKALDFFYAKDEGNAVAGAGVDALVGGYKALTGDAQGANERFRDVGRETLKRIPFVGRGAAREVNSAAQERRGARTGGGVKFK